MEKERARREGLARRAALSAETRRRYDASLLWKMKNCAEGAGLIGCYVSMREEPDTRAFLSWCFETGKAVSVPKVEGNTLQFYRIHSFADLAPGCFGVEEPVHGEPVDHSAIDRMFVPLSSFDRRSHRTGYGKGYYDSVLLPSMKTIGIAYPEQYVERIDTDPWDVPLDIILLPD